MKRTNENKPNIQYIRILIPGNSAIQDFFPFHFFSKIRIIRNVYNVLIH